MTNDGSVRRIECARAMDRVHRRLDGEALGPADVRALASHLAECVDCRQANGELGQIQLAMRELGEQRFPDGGLEQVWEQTTRRTGRARRSAWWAAAAAIVVVSAWLALWQGGRQDPVAPSDAELERAAREARLVLRLAAQAIDRTERAAFADVLGGQVSPALRKVPIRWPAAEPGRSPKDGNDA
ncbi:MAG TPA: zf-HC2 domain-containing protein [Candidatus Polarisedimenticolaceae bacterium]|nr:zf-HC2 domain-containing protein [Candidatus Polarisedimenticolaceae bacterium]